jgi:phage-related protein
MARAQAQYLRIYSAAGVTQQRWQSYYSKPVMWNGDLWTVVSFTAQGSDSDITITAPATGLVVSSLEAALTNSYLVDLNIYQFDALNGNDVPQAEQELLLAYTGQVIGGSGGLTSVEFQLGAPVATIGGQVPPRAMTNDIVGSVCRL